MSELKGACVIGQSGGPTSVINSSVLGALEAALDNPSITRVFGMAHGIKGLLNDDLYDIDKEDRDELALLRYTPSSALGSCRYKLADPDVDDTDYKRILEIFKKYDIRYFFYNGGNDSMDTCNKVSKYMMKSGYECRVMGIPKTIDNDLFGTDHCPGFASAAKYIATSCMEIYQDEKGNCLVAVSEGIHYADGSFVSEAKTSATDGFGHAQLGGLASMLADTVKNELGCKVRGIELSLLQRCAAHCASKTDVDESYMSGKAAVENAVAGKTDYMPGFKCTRDENGYKCEIELLPLSEVANTEKKVPREWINEEGNGVTQEFVDYALPLINGENVGPKVSGLPRFANLKKIKAEA